MELKTRVDDKKVFAKIGLAILICMVVVNIVQSIYFTVVTVVDPALVQKPWIIWLLQLVFIL